MSAGLPVNSAYELALKKKKSSYQLGYANRAHQYLHVLFFFHFYIE
jgi:hypothetical protein